MCQYYLRFCIKCDALAVPDDCAIWVMGSRHPAKASRSPMWLHALKRKRTVFGLLTQLNCLPRKRASRRQPHITRVMRNSEAAKLQCLPTVANPSITAYSNSIKIPANPLPLLRVFHLVVPSRWLSLCFPKEAHAFQCQQCASRRWRPAVIMALRTSTKTPLVPGKPLGVACKRVQSRVAENKRCGCGLWTAQLCSACSCAPCSSQLLTPAITHADSLRARRNLRGPYPIPLGRYYYRDRDLHGFQRLSGFEKVGYWLQ